MYWEFGLKSLLTASPQIFYRLSTGQLWIMWIKILRYLRKSKYSNILGLSTETVYNNFETVDKY